MKTKYMWAFLATSIGLTACDQRFSYQEVVATCTPPPSSARFGENKGPVITEPAEMQPFNATVNVRGTCEPGYDVEIRGKDAANNQTVPCIDGTFSALVSFSNGDGVKELDVSQTLAAGESIFDRRCFTKDTVPPKVVINGTAGAQATNQTTMQITGLCESGLPVTVSGPHLTAPVIVNCTNGHFTATISFTGPDGLKNVVASQVDPAGNSGQDDRNYLTDTTPPVVAITSPDELALSQGTLTIAGQCEGNGRVFLTGAGLGGAAQATDCVNGSFTATIPLSAGDGMKNIIASQTDIAGNTGTHNRNFMRDSTPPLVRILTPDAGTMSNGPVTVTGSCETGLQVVLSGTGLSIPAPTACVGGTFMRNIVLAGPDGAKTIQATQTDAAGNVGMDSRSLIRDTVAPVVTIDQPAAPVVASRQITMAGDCETGLAVRIAGAGIETPETINCANGRYSTTVTLTSGDGVKALTVSQRDGAGNEGQAQRNVSLDTHGPAVAITSPAANSYVGLTAQLMGTCESGLNVDISGDLAAPVSIPCSGGSFSQLIMFSSADGSKTIIARQTDDVGNMGSASRTFIKDTTAPMVTIASPDAGTIHVSGVTLTGTCEDDLEVVISGAGAVETRTTCAGNAYSVNVTFSAGDGVKTISASQTDAAGNTGSVTRDFVRDSDAPTIAIQSPAANSSYPSSLTLTGICEDGLPIQVQGDIISPSTADCNGGNFSFNVVLSAPDGAKTVIVRQTDNAGNVGLDSRGFIRDSIAPVVRIMAPAEGLVSTAGLDLSGVCETGLPVHVTGAGLETPVNVNCVGGNFNAAVTFTAGDGNKEIVASQTDAAGNSSSDKKNYLRDSTAPMITITAPAAGTVARDGLEISGTCESGLVVHINGAGVASAVETACIASAFTAEIAFSNGDGPKVVTATQTDNAGNSSSSSRTFARDTTPPTLAFTNPAENSYVTFSANVSGTCESGWPVQLNGDLVSPVSVNCASDTFTAAVTFTAGDGGKTITATQTDGAGNSTSTQRTFRIDSTAPVIAITAPAANTVAQTGVTLIGTCEAGLTVQISGSGMGAPTSVNCTSGTFSAPITFSNGDGVKNIIASQTDSAGNTASDNRNFIRDSTPPVVAITSPAAGTAAQTGITISGTCETGLNVTIQGTGMTAPVTVNCVGGNFSSPITFSAGDGVKNISVEQTDLAGNSGTDSRDFVRDNTAPAIAFTAPPEGTVASTGLTVSGTCESGLNVQISGAGAQSPVSTACTDGTFSAAVVFSAGDGAKVVTASQTDGAGNTGSASRTFMRDSTGPVVAITAPAPNTVAQNGLTLIGTCESGLQVVLGGAGLGAPASGPCTDGAFSIAFTFSNGDGAKVITASQTDTAGNIGSDSRTFQRDTTAPAVAITSPAAGTSAQTGVTVTGTCESGLNVTLNGSGAQSAVNVMCADGAFSAAVLFSAGEGAKQVVASQTDAAGNTGSSSRNFVRDSVAPAVAITAPAAGTTASSGVTVSGTCESGLNVTLNGPGLQSPVTASCTGGTFSRAIVFSSGDGSKEVIASQMDSAGNLGTDSRVFVRDSTAPMVRITAPAAGTVAATGVRLEGTCESGLNVNLSGSGLGGPTSAACADGAFTVNITFSAGDGAKSITASQTDDAGNTGSDSRSFVRDNTAPIVTINSPAANTAARDGLTISGSCETGLTVNIGGTGIASPSTANCVGGSYTAAVLFSNGDGAKTISVAQTDAAGNNGSASRTFIRDTVAPAVAITAPAPNTQDVVGVRVSGTCESGLNVILSGDLNASVSAVCAEGTFSADVVFSAHNGTKTVVATQTDAAGNTGSDSRVFLKNNNAGYYTYTSQGPGGMVDILFIDDNSASMEEEQRRLGDRFSNLATELSGLDWQIGITTTDCSAGPYGICGSLLEMWGTSDYILRPTTPDFVTVFQNTIRRPETFDPDSGQSCIITNSCPSGTEEGLKASLFAMNKRDSDNAGFFRNGSDLAIVYLSDEDERSNGTGSVTTAQMVYDYFKSIWPTNKKIAAYGIIVRPGDTDCFNQQRAQFGNNANYGTHYQDMVDLTGGASFSICENDYTLTLRQIGEDVTRLSNSVDLPQTPLPGTVNIVFTPSHTTTWTVNGNRVTFETPAPLGTTVEIFYEY